ncbi:MAG: SUMF1/EgtB/PvdO family nonheme iron enzyme [Phycisphaerales bacterium]
MRASLAVSKASALGCVVMLAGCAQEYVAAPSDAVQKSQSVATAPASVETAANAQATSEATTTKEQEHLLPGSVFMSSSGDPKQVAKMEAAQRYVLPDTIVEDVPPAAYQLKFRLIPGSADGSIKSFYMSETEVTWDVADIYIFKLDEKDAGESGSAQGGGSANADAVTRPTKPYLPPDRGFGHEGYAAITMSFHNAKEFCNWLSKRSKNGRVFRLPTEAEWQHASGGDVYVGNLTDYAWFSDNANDGPHPVGQKKANKFGLYDMLGNVQEWCVGPDGTGVTRGGSYRDSAEKINTTHREPANRAWNASDPQVPKSKWWLADGPFVGFRIVCEVPDLSK